MSALVRAGPREDFPAYKPVFFTVLLGRFSWNDYLCINHIDTT